MDNFEQDLRDGLRRKQPAGDFTARILARVEREKPARSWTAWFIGQRAWVAASVLLAIAIGGASLLERRHHERVEGEQARQQVVLALRIASSKLQLAETKVQQLSDKTQE